MNIRGVLGYEVRNSLSILFLGTAVVSIRALFDVVKRSETSEVCKGFGALLSRISVL